MSNVYEDNNTYDNEQRKFQPDADGNVAVNTIVNSSFTPPVNADAITVLNTSTTQTFQYRNGGTSGTILKSVLVTYTNSCKNELLSVEVL